MDIVPDGLRRRPVGAVAVQQKERELLFSGHKALPQQNAQMLAMLAELRATVNQIQEQGAEGLREVQGQLERIEGTGAHLEEGQSTITSIVRRVDAGVKKIGQTTDKILGVTERTERLVTAYKKGNWRDIAHAVLFDEWLVFYTYFLLHPWMPLTMKAFASVWQIVLPARRMFHLRSDLREGRIISFSVGRMVYNYFTSPWKAIALLYFFNQEFARMSAADPAQYASLFPGDLDPAFQGLFSTVINMSPPHIETVKAGAAMAFEEAQKAVATVFASAPHLWEAVETLCPTWAEDKTGFFNCIAAYMAGTLGTALREGAGRLAAVPGLAHQAGMYITVEKQVLFAVSSFLWSQVITPLFGGGLRWAGNYIHAMACSAVGGAWGFGWMGCDALKDKVEGGGSARSRSARRSRSRSASKRRSGSTRRKRSSGDLMPMPPAEVLQLNKNIQASSFLFVKCIFVQENAPVRIRFPRPALHVVFELYATQLKLASSPALFGGYAIELPPAEEKELLKIEDAINSNGSGRARSVRSRSRSH